MLGNVLTNIEYFSIDKSIRANVVSVMESFQIHVVL